MPRPAQGKRIWKKTTNNFVSTAMSEGSESKSSWRRFTVVGPDGRKHIVQAPGPGRAAVKALVRTDGVRSGQRVPFRVSGGGRSYRCSPSFENLPRDQWKQIPGGGTSKKRYRVNGRCALEYSKGIQKKRKFLAHARTHEAAYGKPSASYCAGFSSRSQCRKPPQNKLCAWNYKRSSPDRCAFRKHYAKHFGHEYVGTGPRKRSTSQLRAMGPGARFVAR